MPPRTARSRQLGSWRSAASDGDETRKTPGSSAHGEIALTLTSRERQLKANTVKRRSYSLFNQGCFYYQWMATMPAETFVKLVDKFSEAIRSHAVFREAFGVI